LPYLAIIEYLLITNDYEIQISAQGYIFVNSLKFSTILFIGEETNAWALSRRVSYINCQFSKSSVVMEARWANGKVTEDASLDFFN
jgi:hypothetical protein